MLITYLSFLALIEFLQAVVADETTTCPREVIDDIVWEADLAIDQNISLSQPICFDDRDEIVHRKCSESGEWIPKQPRKCSSRGPTCPTGFEHVLKDEDHCFKITDPSEWSDRICYGTDLSIFDVEEQQELLQYLIEKRSITEFWIPAKRYNNAYGPVLWRILGEKWGKRLREDNDDISSGLCVSGQIRSVKRNYSINIVMKNCDDKLPTICVHQFSLTEQACPKNYFSLLHMPAQCFGVERLNRRLDVHPISYSDFIVMRNNNVFSMISEFCPVESSDLCLTYQFEVEGVKKNIIMTNQGVLKPFLFFTCYVNVIEVKPYHMPKLVLAFNSDHQLLTLTVYNGKRIWRQYGETGIHCFTNADYEQIRPVKITNLIWHNDAIDKSIHELKLHGGGAGYYWCEAHSIFNFSLIETQKIIAAKKTKGFTYAFFIELRCSAIPCYNINRNMKDYGVFIEKIFNDVKECSNRRKRREFRNLVIYNVRVMNVERIVPGMKMKFLCHISASLRHLPKHIKQMYGMDDDYDFLEEDFDMEDDDDDDFEEYLVSVRHQIQQNLTSLVKVSRYAYQNITFNSTDYCFPEFSQSLHAKWQPARIGKTASTYEMCLLPNGLPVSRKCMGDFLYGASWDVNNQINQCIRIAPGTKFITNELYEMISSKVAKVTPTKAIDGLKMILKATRSNLIPADIYYLGKIMKSIERNVVKERLNSNMTIDTIAKTTSDIVTIYNYLMDLNASVTKPTTKLNSTNILLDAFESIIDQISTKTITSTIDNDINNGVNGVIYEIAPKLMTFTIDPSISNVTGVAIYSGAQELYDFRLCQHRLLYSNQSQDDLLDENDLEIATFIPDSLLDRLDEIKINTNETTIVKLPPKIVIKFFINDHLFQEDRDYTDKKVLGKIVSISIPGYSSDLPEMLPIFVRTIGDEINDTEPDSCRYWNYDTWEDHGVEFFKRSNSNDVVLCGCSHITPFAYLVGGYYNLSVSDDVVIITKLHEEALDMITILGCSLSFVGILGIFITAIIFKSWRDKPTSKILLQLSVAIGLQMILFCFVNTEVVTSRLIQYQIYSSCVILGAFLHYSVLVQFSWMLIIAYLQYKRYVQVLGNSRPKRFFLKTFLLGWLPPLVPVLAVIAVSPESYIPYDNIDNSKICYPMGKALYFGVIMPISSIIIANLIIFTIIIYNIIRGPDGKVRQTERTLALSQFRVSLLLFFLLGFTWIFGLLASFRAGIVFSYLFCLTATLQGFILFIYFVVLDPMTRSLWANCVKKVFCKEDIK